MKKYIIKDSQGNKKTIYANSLSDAIKFVDSKLKDVSLTTGDWFTLRNERDAAIYKIVSASHSSYVTDVYRVEADFDTRRTFIKKIGSKSFYTSNVRGRDDITTLAVKFNSAEEAVDWLKKQNRLVSSMLFKKNDSVHDEASLATSINALVNDEEAAIDAYNVAIKNLEGKIDDNAMQVLINIRDDERRHIENLYAILNNQVTEKNLEDSIKDAAPGVDKKKFDRLVNYFNAWGKPSRNELQEVIDYYRLNSATAYQLLYYWGYKNEFEKLHFYDSRIRDAFEVLWYTDKELNNYETKEFKSRVAAMDFYNAHKNDKDKFGWWVTRRNSDRAVVEDIVY